ncbi:MAG: outer membrane lipoprotein-sorting protein [Gammaproteobacteria bacterium]|nr:outer membrane lipoprotein-sorting protein [Gammaproteobacteria bacterium]
MSIKFSTLLIVTLPLSAALWAQTPAEQGLEIANARKAADRGWVSSQSDSLMILRNKQGDQSKRKLRNKSLEVSDDGDKALTIFDTPRDIKGTAFLSFSHNSKNDDQWLYLPALKRVKRISSRNKSGPFMGSEFSYEDMASFEIEKFSFTYLKDQACSDQTCYVVQSIPTDKYSGYSKLISWIDQAHYRVHKVEFYDRKKSHLKTLIASDFKLYNDQFWRAHQATMTNHLTGKTTEIISSNIRFDTGLTAKDFNKNTLKRAR